MKKLLYPIRAVSKLTGISIDTLRAWERRYGAVEPSRDSRGRMYTQAEVQRLQLLHAAVEAGHAIGRIAPMTDQELQRLLAQSDKTPTESSDASTATDNVAALDLTTILDAVDRFDDLTAERELGRLSVLLPPRSLVYQVVLPLMRHVGNAWEHGRLSIAQEHMVSALLRNLLGSLVRVSTRPVPSGRLLFATPSGELHEFGLLCSAMLAASGGLGVTYLGTSLPPSEILEAARRSLAEVIVLGVVGTSGEKEALQSVKQLIKDLPSRMELWVGGARSEELVKAIRSTSAIYLDNFDALERQLATAGARL